MKKKIDPINIIIGIVLVLIIAAALYFIIQSGKKEMEEQNSTADLVEQAGENAIEVKDEPSNLEVNEEVYGVMSQINEACYNYYNNGNENKNLISVYGYLYDDGAEDIVTAEGLLEAGVISCDDEYTNMDILLIKPSSLSIYEGIDINIGDNELELYTALKLKDGYLISSYNNKGGILTTEQYKELLFSYVYEHGAIKNPKSGDAVYEDIMSVVAKESGFNKFDVKHIACDDLYAAVVVGDGNNSVDIREYVLTKIDSSWEIILSGLEKEKDIRWLVNYNYPDMELGLLPKYTIAEYGTVKQGFNPYIESLIELGMVSDGDLPEIYSCGVGKFVYFQFESGKKLLGCVDDNNKLEFFEVGDTEEAIKYMLSYQDTPPVFILKFEEK